MGAQSLQAMTTSLRVLAALLEYPDARLRGFLPEMRELLRADNTLSSARMAELDALMESLQDGDPLDIEAAYVELFDRGRGTSLHLFEHVHGDSRERGPALIDLGQTYEKAGLILAEGELPDFLPAVLEFVSTQPPAEAKAFLGEMAHIYNAIYGALQQRGSAYASVLGTLLELAGETVQPIKPAAEEALDESWAEPVVFDGCSSKGQTQAGQAQPIHLVRSAANPVRAELVEAPMLDKAPFDRLRVNGLREPSGLANTAPSANPSSGVVA